MLVPGDCVASNTEEENRNALAEMAKVLKADVRPSTDLDLAPLLLRGGESGQVTQARGGLRVRRADLGPRGQYPRV